MSYKALSAIRGNLKIDQKDDESRQSMIDKYTTDMTALARRGALDPVIGREPEIERVIEILSRRKKNNPVLIGEPGVGKTVIVEGLAQRIIAANVPEHLLNKRVLSLEMGSLIAGAKMQGEFEERLKTIIDEVVSSAGEIIVFIDELHTVVGAGRSGGGLDASNMLKPALARGLMQCIGATTNREYKQYIESDKALERRFQPVRVPQPTVAQTVEILKGLRPK
ncbi:MAG: AAA family ATPase, partial [Proteobacteria bacterium]|nr:AAA family ATPase [Pseudomonadota bacterium]